jgi:hypothetical protein
MVEETQEGTKGKSSQVSKKGFSTFWDACRYRWYCLEEVWQPGHSWNYRMFRLREALGQENQP